jgi:hypothetical protein
MIFITGRRAKKQADPESFQDIMSMHLQKVREAQGKNRYKPAATPAIKKPKPGTLMHNPSIYLSQIQTSDSIFF